MANPSTACVLSENRPATVCSTCTVYICAKLAPLAFFPGQRGHQILTLHGLERLIYRKVLISPKRLLEDAVEAGGGGARDGRRSQQLCRLCWSTTPPGKEGGGRDDRVDLLFNVTMWQCGGFMGNTNSSAAPDAPTPTNRSVFDTCDLESALNSPNISMFQPPQTHSTSTTLLGYS